MGIISWYINQRSTGGAHPADFPIQTSVATGILFGPSQVQNPPKNAKGLKNVASCGDWRSEACPESPYFLELDHDISI